MSCKNRSARNLESFAIDIESFLTECMDKKNTLFALLVIKMRYRMLRELLAVEWKVSYEVESILCMYFIHLFILY